MPLGRWADHNGNLPAVQPDPSSAAAAYTHSPVDRGASSYQQPWGINPAFDSSPVHSPGWPSPRGAHGGFMHLPPATTPRGDQGANAAAGAFAMPPPPPEGTSAGSHPAPAGSQAQAFGVAWLEAETNSPRGGIREKGAGSFAQ